MTKAGAANSDLCKSPSKGTFSVNNYIPRDGGGSSHLPPRDPIAEMDGTRTWYVLTPPATDSVESLERDAEVRARDRGCECPAPNFYHVVSDAYITTVVDHTSPTCPAGQGVTS
jgi:hypothetical protein